MRAIFTIRTLAFGSCIAFAACSGTSRGPSNVNGQTVTLTGCLQPGDRADTYVLRVPGSPIAGGTGGGAVGTTGGGAGDQSGTGTAPNGNATGSATMHTYQVVAADPKVKLDMNQGTTVSVTGVLENGTANGTTGTSGSGQNQAVGTSGSSGTGSNQAGEQASDASSGVSGQSSRPAREGAKGASPQAGTGSEPAERQQGSATAAPAEGGVVHVTAVHRVAGGCSGLKE